MTHQIKSRINFGWWRNPLGVYVLEWRGPENMHGDLVNLDPIEVAEDGGRFLEAHLIRRISDIANVDVEAPDTSTARYLKQYHRAQDPRRFA